MYWYTKKNIIPFTVSIYLMTVVSINAISSPIQTISNSIKNKDNVIKIKSITNENDNVFDIINDAQEKIKKTEATTNGNLYRISCVYQLEKNTLIKTSTKVYYSDYRRKPEYNASILKTNTNPTQIVEIIYNKSDKKHLSLIRKDPINNKLSSKETISTHSYTA